MLIERLIVRKTRPSTEVIREITFNLNGLSLIVDNTSDIAEDSGNNVGKTTAIKIIDLCLGGKSVRTLYYDDDTKSENIEIKEFLRENKVEAELILIDKVEENNKKVVSITRQLFNNGKRKINDNIVTKDEFEDELKNILFGSDKPYPTLRQLIPKFVRVNDTNSDSMIKYLHGSSSNETYDTIYLFLFKILGDELLSEKDSLATKLKECINKIKLYEKDENISSLDILKQREKLIDNELNDLLKKRKHLDYMDTYKCELQKNRDLIANINNLEEQSQLLEYEIRLINNNVEKLNNEKSNVNISQIKNIYNESKAYIDNIDKTFEDVVIFHNTMIQNRINFIYNQLESKKKELESIYSEKDALLEEKKKITIDILDEGLLEELNVLNTKIENINIQKGEINQSIKILEGTESEKKALSKKIEKIREQMDSNNINAKIEIFNTFFSEYCNKLYGEKYLFVYNSEWKEQGKFPVSLDSFKGNVGTGKKKAVIVAFDLAYMNYVEKMNIKSPKFVIHDKLENTHINQLKTIFKICEKINGQYIVPILRERVDKLDKKLINEATVLELSSDDRFFRT